jgi:RNA polymerase sigma-70 factor, ECF subfamily
MPTQRKLYPHLGVAFILLRHTVSVPSGESHAATFFRRFSGVRPPKRFLYVGGVAVPDEAGRCEPEQLLAQIRGGDDQALGELLNYYRPYLSLLARLKTDRQLQSRFDDSDLVQDTCLWAHRDFNQFRGTTEPEFAAWLRQIMAHSAANRARDHRRQRRDVRLEKRLNDVLNQSSDMIDRALLKVDFNPGHSLLRRERAVMLANALGQLAADYREVLVLRELEGRSLSEAAELMGRTPDAVQKLWARALVQLRRLTTSLLER